MTGYKDMTFCEGGTPTCDKFDECPRALTMKVKNAAALWWGSVDAPIIKFANPESLSCYESEYLARRASGESEYQGRTE